jgi:hypothetical protein
LDRGMVERWLPVKTCPKIAVFEVSGIPLTMITSYVLHRKGWRKMAKVIPILGIVGSGAGAIYTRAKWNQNRVR